MHYTELLELSPLPDNYLLASFTFNSTSQVAGTIDSNDFDILPRSLLQIIRKSYATSLHLRFSRGRWNQHIWGNLPVNGRRSGGTGIEIWASIDAQAPVENWTTLVQSLSGLFCASMNFIDSTRTARPHFTFQSQQLGENFYGVLPSETVCTENLTPFLKLLPCKGHAGISSLLSGHKLFDTDWSVLSVDFELASNGSLAVALAVDLVFDLERALFAAKDPLPGSQPSEDLVCAEDKFYTSDVTCFPVDGRKPKDWSFVQLFGRPLDGRCAVSAPGRADLVVNHGLQTRLVPHSSARKEIQSTYSLSDDRLNLQYSDGTAPVVSPAPIEVRRTLTSHGSSLHGKITLSVVNNRNKTADITYFSILPWFMKPYLHSLKTSHNHLVRDTLYKPAKDRIRPSHLEMKLRIPASDTAHVTFDLERTILRYAEYPPDANRGFDVPYVSNHPLISCTDRPQGCCNRIKFRRICRSNDKLVAFITHTRLQHAL